MGFDVQSYTGLIGLVGVLLYIGSYAAMQFGLIRGQTYIYAGLNALAAGCVLFSLVDHFNLSSAIIQLFWIAISLAGILRLLWLSYSIRFNDDEKTFLQSKFPSLSPGLSRKLLDSGFWVEAEPGKVLTLEGEPVSELIYLAEGEATVSLGEHQIGTCADDTLIGEITCLKGEPASASVTVSKTSRYFCIGVLKLRDLVSRYPELRIALEQSFGSETSKKLIAANEKQRHLATQVIYENRSG